MSRPVLRIFLLALLVVLSGCATKRYVGPTSGRSADAQRAVTAALDEIVREASFSAYAGKSCSVEVVSLAENFGGVSPENEILGAAFREALRRDGLRPVARGTAADLCLFLRARAIGVDVVRRDLPLLYYRETTRAVVDLRLTLVSNADGAVLEQRDLARRIRTAQTYWLYMIGPFESRSGE